MTYQEQIKHPKWQKKRLKILERDQFQCQHCGEKEKTLNVHHLVYLKNKMAWEYEDKHLVTYCNKCHDKWHKINDEVKLKIAQRLIYLEPFNKLLNEFDNFRVIDIENIIKYVKWYKHIGNDKQ